MAGDKYNFHSDMDKTQVAVFMEEIGTLLELKGENPFKSRAYHQAARIIPAIDRFEELVQTGQLTSIKGIGEGLAEKITEMVTAGKSSYLEELQKGLPAGLMEIIRVQGVGPKRAKILYDKLKIKDIPGLEKAAKEGKIAKLEGFGEKSQENILKGLAFLGQHAEYHRYDEALAAAESVLAELKKIPGIQRMSVCGSLRRRREVIRDVDILISSQSGKAVLDKVVELSWVKRVLAHGDTKVSVLFKSGIQVDVRVVRDKEFPYAQHYFTGSKEHNIRMRQRAIEKGWKLSEYGLFDKEETLIPCKDEADIFKKLGLGYIPPELREDRGEMEAAEAGKLPKLIEPSDIRGAFHVHSTWSDGRATLEDMIAEAQALGWEYVGISDHSKSAGYANGLSVERVAEQRQEIERLRKQYNIRIFWGTECDILSDGALDYPDKVLAAYDYVIASIHSHFTQPQEEITKRLLKAIRSPYTTILGHMTGRLLLQREGYRVDVETVLKAAAENDVAVEINAQPKRFDIDWRHLPKAKELGVQLVINPDAHAVEQLHVIPFGVGLARKGWLTKDDVLNTWPLAKMEAWLAK